jgi:hypothetical protein
VVRLAAAARVDQRDRLYLLTEAFRLLRRKRHDGHTAHRVPDEDDVPLVAGGVQNGGEVAADLIDGAVLPGAGARLPVVAVVHEDEPPALREHPLVVPRPAGERPAVGEHERGPGVPVTQDLDRNFGAVVGWHPQGGSPVQTGWIRPGHQRHLGIEDCTQSAIKPW